MTYSAQRQYYERTIDRLNGILAGISTDQRLRDKEIAGLYNWMNENGFLAETAPFDQLFRILKTTLEDHVIDPDEREEILGWCNDYCDNNSLLKSVETAAIRMLHGFLHGIAIDQKLTDEEIVNLKDWMIDFDGFEDVWPFSAAYALVNEILSDGRIEESERDRLLYFCEEFSEKPIYGADTILNDEIYKAGFAKTDAKVLQPLTSICDKNINIVFKDRSFCLTGPAKSGKRTDIHDAIRRVGGLIVNSVSSQLDYLVIGAKSSPCWVYSTYGRKIEQVLKKREIGAQTQIVYEEDFIPILRQALHM